MVSPKAIEIVSKGLGIPPGLVEVIVKQQRNKAMVAVNKKTPTGIDPKSKAARLAAAGNVRVKDAGSRLNQKRYEIKRHDGNLLTHGEKVVEKPSEYDKAIIGVFFKHMLRKQGVACELSEWERSLLAESATRDQWVGSTPNGDYFGGGEPGAYVPSHRVKALLDDTISGGLFMNPVVLDTSIITYPLLHSQLFQFVDLKTVSGRRIMTPTMANLTVAWGTSPGTAVTPFNTAALVNSNDTPLFNVSGFVEISNDLLADSPVAIGAEVTQLYGERLKAELDRVIAVGNGYDEPLGIVNTSGLVTLQSDNGIGGPPTVSDAEALIFGVAPQYRLLDLNSCFVGNDTSYRRFRGIQVGPADERRVFGMGMFGTEDSQRYQLFEYKYRPVANMPNSQVLFGGLKKFRMFQRAGYEIVRESGGRTLTLANTSLVGLRGRFGGQVMDINAFAMISNLQG